MTQIRIDTEHTREVARRLLAKSDRLSEMGHELQNTIGGLDTWAWDGRSRSRTEPRLGRVQAESACLAEGLDELGRKLRRVADIFEQKDNTAARSLTVIFEKWSWNDVTQNDLDASILAWLGEVYKDVERVLPPGFLAALPAFLKADQAFLELIADFAKARGSFRGEMLNIGSFLNWLTGQRGHVGMMDDVYRSLAKSIPYRGDLDKFLRGKTFQYGFMGIGYVLDVSEDIREGVYGGALEKILGVNGVDLAVNYAIAQTGAGAAVLLVNGLVQVGGNVKVGVRRTMADWISTDAEMRDLLLADADQLADIVDRMDVGNVTKEFSEAIYDVYLADATEMGKATVQAFQGWSQEPSYENLMGVTQSLNQMAREKTPRAVMNALLSPPIALVMHPDGRQGLLDTGEAALNVVDGVVDYTVSKVIGGANQSVAVFAKTIDVLPVSAGLKEAASGAAKECIEMGQSISDGIVNLIDF